MCHLQQAKVFVTAGQQVVRGQPLGCVGNSGFSIEPHLHIQAHANTHTGLPWYREQPFQLVFDGKTYLLFQQIHAAEL